MQLGMDKRLTKPDSTIPTLVPKDPEAASQYASQKALHYLTLADKITIVDR